MKEEIERTYILNNLDNIVDEEVPAWLVVTVDTKRNPQHCFICYFS